VVVDVEITLASERHVEPGVTGQSLHEVVQKPDAGSYLGLTRPVEVELHANRGLSCAPGNGRGAAHGKRSSRSTRPVRTQTAPAA